MTESGAGLPDGQPTGPSEHEGLEELKLRLDHLQARLDAHLAEGADLAAARPAAPAPAPAPLTPPSQWVVPGGRTAPPAGPPAPAPASAAAPVWPTPVPSTPAESIFSRASIADLEERLTGRVLAWVGGIALIAGAILFLSLAFSRGWIGPEARVILGLAGGGVALGLGAWLFEESRQRGLAHVLTAVGLGVISVALIAATRLYELIPAEFGLAGALLTAMVAAAIAVRANSQTVAGFGLIAVLAAPPLMGASPNLVTIGFLATALVGTTVIALFRSWAYLPVIAFILSAPQLASWLLGLDDDAGPGVAVLAVYWAINEVAAAGEEVLRRKRTLRPATATLVIANAAFLVAAGFAVLDGSFETWRGPFLAGVALAHFAIGAWFLRAEGDRHLFGLLVTGTGLAALTMAVPVQFGASVVPVAWAAEAVALVWIRVRRQHVYSGAAAAVLGALAIGHILLVEMRLRDLPALVRPDMPFGDAAGLAVLFVVAALLVSAWLLQVAWERAAAISVAVLLVAYALPFELPPAVVVVGWSGLAVMCAAIGTRRHEEQAWWLGYADALAGLGAAAILVNLAPPDRLVVDANRTSAVVPFLNEATVAIAAVAAALVVSSWLHPRQRWSPLRVILAAVVGVYLLSVGVVDLFQARLGGSVGEEELAKQAQVALSVLWAILGASAFTIGLVRDLTGARQAGLVLLGLVTAKVFLVDLAALDVAYRVLSLLALGIVLVGSAYLFGRFRPTRPAV